jgi:two-component system, NarL family, nitrate/nitrite response regulator NarL
MGVADTQAIKILLVDDHAMFRQGLVRVLEKELGFQVVGQFGSGTEALEALSEATPAVILLDIDLGPERAVDFVTESRKKGFNGYILVVTAGTTGPEAVQLVQAGVSGILHKHHSAEELCAKIRQIAAGEVYLEPEYFNSLYRSVDRTKAKKRATLTERDKLVLRFIFQGLTNRDIAVRLNISESGVKSAIRQLFDKLGVRTRAQLVKIALEQYRDQL